MDNKKILSRFSKRERMLAISTIIIVSSVIVYGFIIEPLMGAYSRLNREIEASLMKLEKGHRLLKRKDRIEADFKRYASLIKPHISEEEEIAAMLKVIEGIARSNNILITNIRPQPVKKVDFYNEFVFELVAEANVEQFVKFIYDLQTSGNLLRVRRLTLTSSSSKDNKLKAVMEITRPSLKS